MKINRIVAAALIAASSGLWSLGCRPRTASEKIKDKAEDVRHETGQTLERAGHRMQ